LHQVQHYFPFQIENYIQDYTLRNRREIAVVEDVVVVAEDNDVDIHPVVAAVVAVVAVVVVVVILRRDHTVISIERGIRDILTPDLLVRE
jgi:hypothetical protein